MTKRQIEKNLYKAGIEYDTTEVTKEQTMNYRYVVKKRNGNVFLYDTLDEDEIREYDDQYFANVVVEALNKMEIAMQRFISLY